MLKKISLICLVSIFLLGGTANAAFSALVEPNNNLLGVNFTHMGWYEDQYLPLYGAKAHFSTIDRIAVGGEYYLRQDRLQLINVFIQYQLEDPLFSDTWASGLIGYSDLHSFSEGQRYRGVVAGLLFSRQFADNWHAHTGVNFYIYSGLLDLGFETGFQYFIQDSLSVEMTYKGYPLRSRGVNLGANFHF